MRNIALVALIMIAPVLQGCLGLGGNDAKAEPINKQRALVTDTTGGVEGIVTDNAVAPVEGVTVTLVELDASGTTSADGSFAISKVPPGTYTVTATRAGFVPASQNVVVRSGAVAAVDFILIHLSTEEAYVQWQEQVGFIECSHQVGWDVQPQLGGIVHPILAQAEGAYNNTTGDRFPLARGVGVTWFFLGLATCNVPNSIVFENTTNDRFNHLFDLEAPIQSLIYEMVWDSASTATPQMNAWLSTVVEVDPFYNNDAATVFEGDAQSPVYGRVDRDRFDEVAEYLSDLCADGNDAACISPYDNGWPMIVRVFAAWQCASESAGACAAFQVEFTHYMTGFYNAPAPEGYTALQQ